MELRDNIENSFARSRLNQSYAMNEWWDRSLRNDGTEYCVTLLPHAFLSVSGGTICGRLKLKRLL